MSSHVGAAQLSSALYGCDLVVIPAGVPRKPGMTRDDLFNINAGARSQGAAPRTFKPWRSEAIDWHMGRVAEHLPRKPAWIRRLK